MYDLTRPHLKIVGKNQPGIIIQGGHAFEAGSRKPLGRVQDIMKDKANPKHDYKFCRECGGSFTSVSDLEEHFLRRHREVVLASVSRHAPKNIKGIWTPTDEMVEEEAKHLAKKDLEEDVKESTPEKPEKANWREKK